MTTLEGASQSWSPGWLNSSLYARSTPSINGLNKERPARTGNLCHLKIYSLAEMQMAWHVACMCCCLASLKLCRTLIWHPPPVSARLRQWL